MLKNWLTENYSSGSADFFVTPAPCCNLGLGTTELSGSLLASGIKRRQFFKQCGNRTRMFDTRDGRPRPLGSPCMGLDRSKGNGIFNLESFVDHYQSSKHQFAKLVCFYAFKIRSAMANFDEKRPALGRFILNWKMFKFSPYILLITSKSMVLLKRNWAVTKEEFDHDRI